MAKKTTQGRRSTQGSRAKRNTSASTSASSSNKGRSFNLKNLNRSDVEKYLNKAKKNPAALYIAGGIGTFFAARFAFNYYRKHPEIKEFIKDNFDTVESKLKEYRGGIEESEIEARH